jgi:hypothetical protein
MTILLQSSAPPPVEPKTRNKTGVASLVKKAPAGQQTLEWWIAWLRANW